MVTVYNVGYLISCPDDGKYNFLNSCYSCGQLQILITALIYSSSSCVLSSHAKWYETIKTNINGRMLVFSYLRIWFETIVEYTDSRCSKQKGDQDLKKTKTDSKY
jgi:hypothetical protein